MLRILPVDAASSNTLLRTLRLATRRHSTHIVLNACNASVVIQIMLQIFINDTICWKLDETTDVAMVGSTTLMRMPDQLHAADSVPLKPLETVNNPAETTRENFHTMGLRGL